MHFPNFGSLIPVCSFGCTCFSLFVYRRSCLFRIKREERSEPWLAATRAKTLMQRNFPTSTTSWPFNLLQRLQNEIQFFILSRPEGDHFFLGKDIRGRWRTAVFYYAPKGMKYKLLTLTPTQFNFPNEVVLSSKPR